MMPSSAAPICRKAHRGTAACRRCGHECRRATDERFGALAGRFKVAAAGSVAGHGFGGFEPQPKRRGVERDAAGLQRHEQPARVERPGHDSFWLAGFRHERNRLENPRPPGLTGAAPRSVFVVMRHEADRPMMVSMGDTSAHGALFAVEWSEQLLSADGLVGGQLIEYGVHRLEPAGGGL